MAVCSIDWTKLKRTNKQTTNVPEGYAITPVADRIAILASGGLDSSVMLGAIAQTGRHVFPIYIRAGLSWERDELARI